MSEPWARVAAKALALVGVLSIKFVSCEPREPDCRHAVRETNDGLAVVVCEREYTRTQDPAIGALLASSLRRSGKRQEASALASTLLATSAQSDALQVLGKIDYSEKRFEAGLETLEKARRLHVIEKRPQALAVDDQALAAIFWAQKRFAEALRALDTCITESRDANDRVLEAYCHMTAGEVLGEVGYFKGAREELERAEPLLEKDRDLAALEVERGGLDQHYGLGPLNQTYNVQAVGEFKRAIEYARAAARPWDMRRAELNLIYSLAELGRTDEAALHLEAVERLDPDGSDVNDRELLSARIAYRGGDLARATSINTRVYGALRDDDDRLRLCVMQAEIGLATGDLEGTITWATRGIDIVEKMHGEQSAIELRPWMMSLRRRPHELLFTAFASAHRVDDALTVFDQWQGRTLLDAMARAKSAQPSSLREAAMHTEDLGHLFPVLSNAPIMKTVDRERLIAAVSGVELVALLVANDEVWRITSLHGRLDLTDLGPYKTLRQQLEDFETNPTRTELGDALGTKLLGDNTFRDTTGTLFVLLDGPITSMPIAALRARGRPLVATRTIVRASRLSELGCVSAPSGKRHAVVIADARSDLPAARIEARKIAAMFGVTPSVGAAATRDALFAASKDDVLHVATHASVELGSGSLEMHDQRVSALEILARGSGPALVFLSACASAAADDGERATALATAFLASGSAQVIATLHSVTDPGASEITSAFYRNNGVADPARALAHVQAALAQTSNVDWPNFVLFGHDTCRKELP